MGLRRLSDLEEFQPEPSAFFPSFSPILFCARFAWKIVAVEYEVWGNAKMYEHADTVHGKFNESTPVSWHLSYWDAIAYFVVGLSWASSMAHAAVPRCSHP